MRRPFVRPARPLAILALIAASAAPAARAGAERPVASDDATFRPTVLIGKGDGRGSGTIIASVDNETLVLTAAHVVTDAEEGRPWVELHRYNLGLERKPARPADQWPRMLRADVVAIDRAADLAVLRIRGMVALPYVATLAVADADLPRPGATVISVGIDKATKLSSWTTTLRGLIRLDLDDGDGARPYWVTERPPEHGRSGGGLFREDGRLIGVCVGRAQFSKKLKVPQGVFASGPSIQALLSEHGYATLLDSPSLTPARDARDVQTTRHPSPPARPRSAPRTP